MKLQPIESRASDIHVEPFEDRVRIRFRIDGVLSTALTLPQNLHSAVITRIKILSDLKIDETRLAQDGRFSTRIGERKIDFRVSTFPTKNGEKTVMRILDPLTGKIDLPDLGLDGRALEIVEKAMAKPFGSILITGPTGSGKSTTLAGMLKRMNTEDVNIVTLEDPIEYFVDGVNQSQVHEEIGYTFASGLRHILRQDPDIIMVGEIRDRETAALATQAALTGHIVLSTLHTNDAIGVVPRLIDMGVEKYLIPPTLNVAAAQRLLRRLCPTCKLEAKANAGEEKIINDALNDMPEDYQQEFFSKSGYQIFKPNIKNPCKECGGKAFKGRIAIFEMLEMTDEFEKIILGTLSEAAMRQEGKRQGMIVMFQDGILKVLKGVVSLEELLEVAQAGDSA
ncbi:MAG: Type II secretion system protein E [Parcubacteria group bacterium GW2011_GWA1_48_11b]|nr:MAG: Type II secretion system protein E [Parcubacteria group bacterium GW2011_GWA1_48_11b]